MITPEIIETWRVNYGLDKRSPVEAARWWANRYDGLAPAGAVAAFGYLLNARDADLVLRHQGEEPMSAKSPPMPIPTASPPPLYTRGDPVDPVNDPPHYTQGEIQCIDAIMAALTEEEFRGFVKGNVLKYVWRERLKGGTESLAKAKWYLDCLT